MNCWSKLAPWEYCCFHAPQGEPGCPEPQAEIRFLRGHQPQVFAATAAAPCPAVPAALADGATPVPQGHRSSHTALHHPPLLLSP